MNLLDIINQETSLKWTASSCGGEYAGPCPVCGGKDRFRVWPNHPRGTGGKYWCRGCGEKGDAIDYLRTLGLSFAEAREALGLRVDYKFNNSAVSQGLNWQPYTITPAEYGWSEMAGKIVDACHWNLLASSEGLALTTERGFSMETVKANRLGWNPHNHYDQMVSWGLVPENNPKTGRPFKVCLAAGLVIPTFHDGNCVSIKVRRQDWHEADHLPKYMAVRGSERGPMALGCELGKPVVVVESELDAILVNQEVGEHVGAMALRTAKGKPDDIAHAMLLVSPRILVSLDYDDAGREATAWWFEHYEQAQYWPVPKCKDPGEYCQSGGNLRRWIMQGLEKERSN